MNELKTLKGWMRDNDDLIAVQAPSEIKETIYMWQIRIDGAREKGASEERLAPYVAKVEEMKAKVGL